MYSQWGEGGGRGGEEALVFWIHGRHTTVFTCVYHVYTMCGGWSPTETYDVQTASHKAYEEDPLLNILLFQVPGCNSEVLIT